MTSQLPEHALSQYELIMKELSPFVDRGDYTQANQRISTILEGVPDTGEYKLLRGALLSRRADFLLELTDENSAWSDVQEAMNLGWYNSAVYSIAGWVMYHMEKPELALEQFNRSLELNSDRISSLMGRSMIHIDDEEYDLAYNDLSNAIKLDPDSSTAYTLRSEVCIYLGTLTSAKSDIEKARKLDPKDPDIGLAASRLKYIESDYASAKTILDMTIHAGAELLESLLLRSHLHLLKKEFKDARKDAIRATQLFPNEAIVFAQLGLVQYADESFSLAEKAVNQAIEIDDTLADAFFIRGLIFKATEKITESEEDFNRIQDVPLDLADFLFGPLSARFDAKAFFTETLARVDDDLEVADKSKKFTNPFAGGMPIPGMGGMDPTKMLDKIFDNEGNIKPMFKPMLKMMMKNAPAMMKNVPPSMLKKMGNIDPNTFDNFDPSQLSDAQIEEQLKMFYKMAKSGKLDLENKEDPK